ncbi:F-box domain, cyclin-like protein [Artemisia annua]|uniref:F-box domain, cyclin-like protein n=1 Tax=Artemisia annua TaxID=35608 RepID=A0A2U1M2U1_ARTAN|nr:F-box domain, cyclin-like protein [Artemisia annua]
MKKQKIVEDGYGPSEDEDDDYYNQKVGVLKDVTKKRKMIKKTSLEYKKEEYLQDPLVVFGWDIMLKILNHLDARSVALSLMVSRGWHGVASSDAIWSKKCEGLWAGKAHIPRVSQIKGLSKLDAYSLSVMDGKRSRIMKEDLWDHAWEFHFKKSAPAYWHNMDPHWIGTGPPMRRYFHPDGSQTADPGDKVWGGHECCYSIVTSLLADGKMREHYVRINRWPRMSISRKRDWGWKMSNHLYSYSSVPDADKKGGTGPCL